MSPSFQAGHALLIGAGADLPFTIDDARGIAEILKDPDRCAYPPGQVELLVGEAAHRQAVLEALDRMAESADESSTIIIYFSGHGYRASTPIGEAYFLIPFGVQIERLKDTAISGSEFAARLQAIRSRKLLLLLDCCHAGGVGLAKGLEIAKSPLPPEALQILKQGKGRVIIASCKDSELSYGGKPYSAFTLALIEAFSGQGASKQDGFVRAADLAMHSREKVPGRTKGRQHPILHFEEADNFVLAYYAGGETEPKGLPFAQETEIEPEPGAWSGVFDQRGQIVHGTQTNNAGNVLGSVFSGQFHGPVATGGEAVDMQGSTGEIYKPSGSVSQHFGDINNIIIPKAEEIPSIPTIPDPPPDFTGRDDELKELQAKFASGTNIIGLRGNGGVGKTAFALKLGESLKDRYPDGQVMVDMRGTSDNPLSPLEAMGSVIHAYHPSEKIPDNEAEIKEICRRFLNGKRALLLLDNAIDDKQVLKLIPPKSCGLLVTSRKTIKLPGLFRKDLYVLKPEEALDLLFKVWSSTSSSADLPRADPAWSEIARLCGFLPLALRAAASLLANTPDLSPANYAEELKDERTRLERIGMEGVELSVDASFNLSFKRLDTKTQQTFLMASVFPADFDGQAEEVICQDEGHRNLSELVRWSLVEYQRSSQEGEGRYHLHDLVRLFAAGRLEENGGEVAGNDLYQHHAEYYRDVLSLANEFYKKGDPLAGLKRFDLERMNIEAGLVWTKKNLSENDSAASLCNHYLSGPHLLELRMLPQERILWLETALAAARQLKDRSFEGMHLGNLGLAYVDLGDVRKAIEYFKQSLAIHHEIRDMKNEGADLDNLGIAYAFLGDAHGAIELFERHLAIAREIGYKNGEGNALGNLGNAYANLDETLNAIQCYEQRLIIAREIMDKKGEGNGLGCLGTAYADLGETPKAIEYYEQALAISREIGHKRNEGAWLGNLGIAYADLGDAKKAIEYYEQQMVIAREIGDRTGEGNALGNLGNAYAVLGETRKAIEYYEQQMVIAREIGDRRGEGNALGNLGIAYAVLGDARKAIEYYEQQMVIAREIGDRRGEGNALGNLGIAYAVLGDARKAIEYYEQQLKIAQGIGDRRGEGNALVEYKPHSRSTRQQNSGSRMRQSGPQDP